MENLISTCYVIESNDCGVEPIIYLRGVLANVMNERVHSFNNPFEAKAFIKEKLGDQASVFVTKETLSQLHTVNG